MSAVDETKPLSQSWGGRTRSLPPKTVQPAEVVTEVSDVDGIEPGLLTLQPGASIGRYVVLEPLGEGAMGRVVRAYDPKLAREVALKQVKTWAIDGKAEERLAREARAMARLSHPNAVGIYDVEIEQDRVLIVMEYVGGQTMKEWLGKSRSMTEVLDVCRQAGRGLAAAHAAGLVHRDFKPANVLIGKDGRARVTDFGLARVPGDPLSDEPVAAEAMKAAVEASVREGDARLTRTGAVVGTPAYMAPEQHERIEADARADQYAFCVTLWEGLFGARPFRDEDLELKSEGPPEPPRGRGIPRSVLEVLRRGLAPDPRKRWRSMRHLLDALDRGLARRRRVWLTTAGATVAGAVGLWALLPGPHRCGGADEHLAEVWGQPQRERVEQALQRTGVRYAGDAWSLVQAEFDGYGERWVEMHTDACEATSVRGEQSTEVLDLRMACLARARDELSSAVAVLAQADATVVERAREVATGLPSLSHCADVERLRTEQPPPEDPEVAQRVDTLRRELAELAWLRRAGKYDEALQRIEALRARADELDHSPLRAEVRLLHGRLLSRQARSGAAEQALREALQLGLEEGSRGVVVEAIVSLLEVVGAEQSRPAEAKWLASLGMGLATRWHLGDEALAALHRGRGLVLSAEGDLGEAEQEHRRALELLLRSHGELHLDVLAARLSLASVLDERSKHEEAEAIHREVLTQYEAKLGPTHPEVAQVHVLLGRSLAQQGRYAEAEVSQRHALTLLEAALGPEHPAVGRAANQLGTSLYDQAEYDEAEREFLRALEILEAAPPGARDPMIIETVNNLAQIEWRRGRVELAEEYTRRALALAMELHGSDHPDVGRQRNNLALVLKARGQLEEAQLELGRCLEIYRSALGPDHPRVATALLNRGNILLQRQRPTEALLDYQRARRILEGSLGPEHPKVAILLYNLGAVHIQLEDFEAAEPLCRRALEIKEKTMGTDHPDNAVNLACLAQVARGQGRFEDAVASYERALELGGVGESSMGPRPELRFGLAQSLYELGERDRALTMAREVLAVYRGMEGDDPMRNEVADWLRARTRPSPTAVDPEPTDSDSADPSAG